MLLRLCALNKNFLESSETNSTKYKKYEVEFSTYSAITGKQSISAFKSATLKTPLFLIEINFYCNKNTHKNLKKTAQSHNLSQNLIKKILQTTTFNHKNNECRSLHVRLRCE